MTQAFTGHDMTDIDTTGDAPEVQLAPNTNPAQKAGTNVSPDVETAPQLVTAPEPSSDQPVASAPLPVAAKRGRQKGKLTEAEGAAGQPSQAEVLLGLISDVGFFHAANGTAYAYIFVKDHFEIWLIRSRGFRDWLTERFYRKAGKAPGREPMQSALDTLEARARIDGPEEPVFQRVGEMNGRLYLDLGNAAWQAVEITAEGWRVVDTPLVRFRRPSGMKALPIPQRGGSIEALRPFLNVGSDADFVLVVCWILAALRPTGPYPLLAIAGEQGSAKSTFSTVVQALVDPKEVPLRALSRDEHELFIAANNAHVLAFDNLSNLSAWISDSLCKLATGGGFTTRQLFSDMDEVQFKACRPMILNGIGEVVERPDLADRSLFMTLQPIPDEKRRPEKEFWYAFEAELPGILGALLDGLVTGLVRQASIQLPRLPRMADFALWSAACETAYWPQGTFLRAYESNRGEAIDGVIDADPVAAAVRALMTKRTEWTGTATALLDALGQQAGDSLVRDKNWLANPRILSGRLRRAATFLRKVGIEVELDRREGRGRTRVIWIRSGQLPVADTPNKDSHGASAASVASAWATNAHQNSDHRAAQARTHDAGADAKGLAGEEPCVRASALRDGTTTAADDADADLQTLFANLVRSEDEPFQQPWSREI